MKHYHITTRVSPYDPHFDQDRVVPATNARVAVNKTLRDLPDLDSVHDLKIIVRRT